MLRLFCDCIDISDPDSDGWLVHEWLKKAYATERRPISQNSITWLLAMTANEECIEFSDRNVWLGLQHGIRSVLNHGRFDSVLERILDLSDGEYQRTSQRHLDSLGAWLALRATGRALLPMIISAGSFLQMRGFDWVDDDMPHRQFLQAIPGIYSAWCHAVIKTVEEVELHMREDLQDHLTKHAITREALLDKLSCVNTSLQRPGYMPWGGQICTDCKDDYSVLGYGLVQPARITITECVTTGHSFDCRCKTIEAVSSISVHHLPTYSGAYTADNHQLPSSLDHDNDDDEFFDAEPQRFYESNTGDFDAFSDIATMMYRAHGRAWIGSYAVDEQLCGSCFLYRERYISDDGLAADFPSMPRSFEGQRMKWAKGRKMSR